MVIELTDSYTYDVEADKFYFKEEELVLSKKQHLLLQLLAEDVGFIVSKGKIKESIWGDLKVSSSTVRSLVNRTRELLKDDIITSYRGLGYKIAKRSEERKELPDLKQLLNDIERKNDENSLILVKVDNLANIKSLLGSKYTNYFFDELIHMLKNMYNSYQGLVIYKLEIDLIAILVKNDRETANMIATETVSMSKYFYVTLDDINIASNFTIGLYTGAGNVYMKATDMLHSAILNGLSIVIGGGETKTHDVTKENIYWLTTYSESIEHDTLVPYYQPIMNNLTDRIEKFECLARIITPDSVVVPDKFLSLVSQIKSTPNLTKAIVRKSFEYFKTMPEYISFSINLDVTALEDSSMFKYIEYWQNKAGIAPHRVVFEILETVDLYQHDVFKKGVENLKQRGYKIAIDDFGTGYSNFVHMYEEKIDFIKIDGSFIKNLDHDQNLYDIVSYINKLIKVCGAQSIAEYVYNDKIKQLVKDIGIDFSQGYAIGEPKPEIIL